MVPVLDKQVECVVCGGVKWVRCPDLERVSRPLAAPAIVRCTTCGLRRVDPMPTQEHLRAIYDGDGLKHEYAAITADVVYVSGDDEVLPFIRERFALLQRLSHGPGRILDIGAAQGAFRGFARAEGWDVAGLEFSEEGRARALERFGIALDPVPVVGADLPPCSFDAVNMSHVLEHVPDMPETLAAIHRLLKPGGLFCVEVPNEFDDLFGVLRANILGRPRDPYPVASPHTYFFTPTTLRRLLAKSGFSIEHFATPRRNAAVASRFPLGRVVKSAVFAAERVLSRGPLIEAIARKR